MSEYISIDVEYGDDPNLIRLTTNLHLAPEGREAYRDRESGDRGSPLAQTLFSVDGLAALEIDANTLHIHRESGIEWHILIDEITEALKDFFL